MAAHNAEVDPAGHAEQDAGKSVLENVVAQAQYACGIVGLVAVDLGRDRSRATPAGRGLRPLQRDDTFAEGRKLRCQRTIGIQHERRAVEHQFVLAADLVEVNQRQIALGHPRHRDRQPDIILVARIGRAVGHDENFRPGFSQALDDVLVVLGFFDPGVLADRHADSHAANRQGTPDRASRKHALLVEHAVIRQIDLEADGRDPPAIQQRAGIVEFAVVDPWAADQHGRSAIGGLSRKILDRRAARRLERGFQDQIFRGIAGNEQFRKHHQRGAVGLGLRARGASLDSIAGNVSDRRIQLGERDLEGGFSHGCMCSQASPFCNCHAYSGFARGGHRFGSRKSALSKSKEGPFVQRWHCPKSGRR